MRRVLLLMVALVFFAILQTRHQAYTAAIQVAGLCPALVQDALSRVEQLCTDTGRNQICYGHSVLLAEPRPEIRDALLSTPGDITDIHNVNRVRLFPMDVDLGQWGVALMRVQANLPNSLPGQNVLFLLFGDVELAPEAASQFVSTNSTVPSEPVRAFRLRSGVGAPLCDDAPLDGLLIQTPHGVGRVELTINGVDLNLGSTVFFRAQESGYLTVSTLEGSALVSTEDGDSLALAGSQVQVPLNENMQPAAPPMLPEAYDLEALSHLPLAALERPVEIHSPLTDKEIEQVQQAILEGEVLTLLPEVKPEPTDHPIPDCPGDSCFAQPPENPGGGPPENPGGGPPENPGGGPPENPGGGPPENPGGGPPENPGGGPPENPGGGPPENPGGGPPENPGGGGGGGNPHPSPTPTG